MFVKYKEFCHQHRLLLFDIWTHQHLLKPAIYRRISLFSLNIVVRTFPPKYDYTCL